MEIQPETAKKSAGKAADEFFETIGKKADHLAADKKQGNGVANSTKATTDSKTYAVEEDQKVVDEIESLCMNCRENVPPNISSIHFLY